MPLSKRFPNRDEIAAVRAEADALEPDAEADTTRRLAGRVMARRDMGKLMFLDLVDRSGRIQLLVRPDHLGGVDVDLGDIVGVEGGPTKSRRGERRLAAARFRRPAFDAIAPRRAVARRPLARAAGEDPRAAAGHPPRRHGRRAALPSPLPRSADERRLATPDDAANADRRGNSRLPRR